MISRARILCSLLATLAALPSAAADAHTQLATSETGGGALLEQILTQRTRPLFASIRAPNGVFGPLRPIYPARYYFENQRVAVDDAGGAVAIWTRLDGDGSPPPRVLVATRRPGERFGPPRILGRDVDYDAPLLAVNPRGDAIVVWRRFERAARYSFRPAGGSFSAPITIPAAERADAIALDHDGGAFLVWATSKGNVDAAYRPPGGSFGAPQPVDGPPPEQGLNNTAVAIDRDGDMLLVWPEAGALQGAERRARGASFGTPVVVATGLRERDEVDALAVQPGGQGAVAYGTSPLKLAIRQAGIWTAPQALPVGDLTEGFRLAMNRHGDAALTWASLDRAVHAAYRPAGSAFGRQRKLAAPRPFAPGGDFVRPGLAINGTGRATATWEESDGRHVAVYARDFFAGHARARVRVGRFSSYQREGPPSDCRPSWGRVIRSARQSTVLVSKRGDDKGFHYACLLARGAAVSLFDEEGLFPPIPLAGPFVGYASDSCGPDDCETLVTVTDLRDEGDGVNRGATAGPGGTSEVPAIVLKANGAVAWVSCSSPGPEFGRIYSCASWSRTKKRVYAFDRRSVRPRRVAVSRRIAPKSLELRGSRLTWRDGRKLRSTRLR